jgi:hypothetical protein
MLAAGTLLFLGVVLQQSWRLLRRGTSAAR